MPAQNASAQAAVVALARAMQRVGVDPGRIERSLTDAARTLGLGGAILALPGAVWAAVDGPDEPVRLVRAPPVEDDLGQLEEVLAVCDAAAAGTLDAVGIQRRLAAVRATPAPRLVAVLGSFALLSATAAVVFGGGAVEAVAGGGTGLAVGATTAAASRRGVAGLGEAAAALAAALVGGALAHVLGAAADRVVLAGLIVLVPGYTMHRGLSDLSTGHLLSGSARMAQAATVFLMMGFGVALGGVLLAPWVGGAPAPVPRPFGAWAHPFALAALVPGLLVLFRAPRGLALPVGGALGATWLAGELGHRVLGAGLGPFLGALALGLIAEAWSRRTGRPATLLVTPALIVLVSGGLGFRGVDALLRGDAAAAVQTGFVALLSTASLVAGLLLAGALTTTRAAGPSDTAAAPGAGRPDPRDSLRERRTAPGCRRPAA